MSHDIIPVRLFDAAGTCVALESYQREHIEKGSVIRRAPWPRFALDVIVDAPQPVAATKTYHLLRVYRLLEATAEPLCADYQELPATRFAPESWTWARECFWRRA